MLDFDVTNYIAGEMVVGSSDRVVDSINPANGRLFASVRYVSPEEVAQAANAGQKAGQKATISQGDKAYSSASKKSTRIKV